MNTHSDDTMYDGEPNSGGSNSSGSNSAGVGGAGPDITAQDDAQLRGLLSGPASRLRADVRMERTLHQITDRGRRLQRRHRYAVSTAGVAAAAAIAVGAVVVPGGASGGGPGTTPPTKAANPNVDLAAFSLKTNPDGTVMLTFRQLGDATTLQQYLDQAGIKAQVAEYKFQEAYVPGILRVWDCGLNSKASPQERAQTQRVVTDTGAPNPGVFVLHPDAMPAGSTLDIVIAQFGEPTPLAMQYEVEVFDGAVPTCHVTEPTATIPVPVNYSGATAAATVGNPPATVSPEQTAEQTDSTPTAQASPAPSAPGSAS